MIEKRKKSKPAYQKSYEIIRDKILDGELPGGMKIVEEKLANELGFSLTPKKDISPLLSFSHPNFPVFFLDRRRKGGFNHNRETGIHTALTVFP